MRIHDALKPRPKSGTALRNTHNFLLPHSDLAWPEASKTSHLCKITMEQGAPVNYRLTG